jgi:outer membrane lipoprotein-sorting protein
MRAIMKLAAVAAVAFALVAGLLFTRGGPGLAFAQVAAQIAAARTMTMDVTTAQPGQPPVTVKAMFREPGQWRFEHGDTVAVADAAKGVSVTFDRKQKVALILHMPSGPAATSRPGAEGDWLATLKRITKVGGKPVGQKEIDGVKASGFEVVDGAQRYVVWANPADGAPVRVELITSGVAVGMPAVTMDHIKLDVPLADQLFNTTVPAGYTAQEATLNVPNRPPAEQDLIDLLRAYAKHNNGNYGYAGETTTLRDAAKPLFWYRPQGAAKDRVIYGDLHTGEADPADLPPATQRAADLLPPAPLASQPEKRK